MSEDGNRLPDIDALIQARDTQEARMNEIINVAEAENVVAVARADDLVGAFRAAMRRYETTRRQAADAQRNGSPDEIAEASKLERQAYADTLNIAAKASAESRAILATAEGSLQEVNEQVESVLGARKALDNALAPRQCPSAMRFSPLPRRRPRQSARSPQPAPRYRTRSPQLPTNWPASSP